MNDKRYRPTEPRELLQPNGTPETTPYRSRQLRGSLITTSGGIGTAKHDDWLDGVKQDPVLDAAMARRRPRARVGTSRKRSDTCNKPLPKAPCEDDKFETGLDKDWCPPWKDELSLPTRIPHIHAAT